MKQIVTAFLLLISTSLFSQVCENKYGKVVISEIFFDTRFQETITSSKHHYGEYIELYNSSDTPIDLTGWTIQDNHTQYTLSPNNLNSNFIIQPGGYKIITYGGFYFYSGYIRATGQYLDQGAPITRETFMGFFPEIASVPNFQSTDIILQNTMVLYNDSDHIKLFAPNGKIVDQIKYNNDRQNDQLIVYGTNTQQGNELAGNFLDNNDGGIFYGPMAGIPRRIDPNNINAGYVTDSEGKRIYDIDDNLKKAIYRSTANSYYSNQQTVFAVETASPFRSPNVTVPLMPLDPFMTVVNPIYPNSDNQAEVFVYDIKTQAIIGQSKTYFDDSGKPTVSISKDYQNNLSWASETVYDNFGRKWKESFPTVTCMDFDNVKYLSNPNLKSQFLDKYYSNNNTNPYEAYQATAEQPYSEINYDNSLNPGSVINVVGGNKIVDSSGTPQWKTGYSYTVPAAQEMYYAFGYNYYDGPIANGKEEVITKFFKSVSVDANGVENVAFSDGENKTLAAARSGGPANYPVYSLIGTQGFVDIHIPSGAPAGTLIGNPSNYEVFNLRTGIKFSSTPSSLPSGEGYRVALAPNVTIPTTNPKVYIAQTPAGGTITYDAGALGVTYNVNYYDYTLNVYNKIGQLIKNIQPKGYQTNIVIKDAPAHMLSGSTAFISTYTYNKQGLIEKSVSPDQGTSNFLYRNDGQIRYSQNQIQTDTKVAYTNYDDNARPIETGIITKNASGIWSDASNTNLDNNTILSGSSYSYSEQAGIIYDYIDNNQTSMVIPPSLSLANVLTSASINPTDYIQENLAGNVACTFNKTGNSINAITWYNYDAYGRVTWIVQYNEELGAKTIHYEYDYKGNVVKVIFQKNNSSEIFVHRYTYNSIDNALTKVETSRDNINYITHAAYTYYKTGELKRAEIAQGTQGLDYVYTLNGQLKSINHPSLLQADDPGHDANDVFGIILDYHDGDYKRANTNITSSPTIAGANQDFNGNIKAARWGNRKSVTGGAVSGPVTQGAYMYNYNPNGWLTNANYGSYTTNGTITNNNQFKEGNITYDENGNIKTLQRTDKNGQVIDNLSYNYNNNNQLNYVADSVNPGILTDIDNQSSGNYGYNAVGQLISNAAETLTYTYNAQGLTTEVKRAGNTLVKFFYNERGQRIKKESYNASGITTDYYALDITGNVMAVYQKTSSTPITQKDLMIYGLGTLGTYTKGGIPADDAALYQITDHQGSVRAIIHKKVNSSLLAVYISNYYPFGEKLLNGDLAIAYRYAYQGQELDEETQMEAFQLRLWDGRIGRWLTPDPYGQYTSPYLGMGNDPINMIDSDGGVAEENFGFGKMPASMSGGDYYKPGIGFNVGSQITHQGISFDQFTDFIMAKAVNTYNNSRAFIVGFGNAFGSNLLLGQGRTNPQNWQDSQTEGAFRFGQLGGDIFSMVAGKFEAGAGIGTGTVAIAAAPETGGASLIALPEASGLIVHGGAVTGKGAANTAGSIIGLVNYFAKKGKHSSGGSNEPEGPGKLIKKGLELIKKGLVQSHDIYQGRENPDWTGAKEYKIPGTPPQSPWRILERTNPDGSTTWGWTKNHYKKNTIIEF
ncbi:lamin tail domain-containing protein [Flavobacterium sp. H122]|uniref:lamin tail domain-containing protein n=1 Tax=Flavobacterium sp. H122 TaxID=2529860 RepID=UPI0010A9B508|nr:lamin tail domain-containing protein [Flavobacterium sp. H122]